MKHLVKDYISIIPPNDPSTTLPRFPSSEKISNVAHARIIRCHDVTDAPSHPVMIESQAEA